ncbi:hypothetical protein GMRT_15897 [Giardia muris]|uniref:PCI domain-containing protein n=1 Tax=Giardia muris TaxID=5742 RepID=A0A4Z1SW15_GIAMU|nr:hypothetical protein GMRT_15897 [Giardia muris]|eukprot:TNJ29946.1 hypothetical protein GMRT_15897 [Giardia muris]
MPTPDEARLQAFITSQDWYDMSLAVHELTLDPSLATDDARLARLAAVCHTVAYALDPVILMHLYSLYARTIPRKQALSFLQGDHHNITRSTEALAIFAALQYLLDASSGILGSEGRLWDELEAGTFNLVAYAVTLAAEAACILAAFDGDYNRVRQAYGCIVRNAIAEPWSLKPLVTFFPMALYSAFSSYGHANLAVLLPKELDASQVADETYQRLYCLLKRVDAGEDIRPEDLANLQVSVLVTDRLETPVRGSNAYSVTLDFSKIGPQIQRRSLQNRILGKLCEMPLALRHAISYDTLLTLLQFPEGDVTALETIFLELFEAGIIKGTLNTLLREVSITLVQARVMNEEQALMLVDRLHEWADRIAHTREQLEKHGTNGIR